MLVIHRFGRSWAALLLGLCLSSSADTAQAQSTQILEPVHVRGTYQPGPSSSFRPSDLSLLDTGGDRGPCAADHDSAEAACGAFERSVKDPNRVETPKEEQDRIRKGIEERRKERKATCNKIFDVAAAQIGQRAQAERAACENSWSVGGGIGAIAKRVGLDFDIKWLSGREACMNRVAEQQKLDMARTNGELKDCESLADAQAALELAQQGLSG